MKRGYVEAAIFIVAAVGAFGFAWYLAQTVGLHPLIVHAPADREKYWTVAVGCAIFVVLFDAVLFALIARKQSKERQAAELNSIPSLVK
jgi:hypothetical protein